MTTTTAPTEHEATEIATEVAGIWLTEAYANRRDDLLTLIDDVDDDPAAVYYELTELLSTELKDSDELELDGTLNRAISDAAVDISHTLPLLLLRVMTDELGERLYDVRLPNTIRETIIEVTAGHQTACRDVELLLLSTLIEVVNELVNSTV